MSAGKLIGYIVAAILIFFGVLFIWAAFSPEGQVGWIVVGIISVAIGLGIIALVRLREPKPAQAPQEIIQKIDLSGDMQLETLKCEKCGGELQKDSISIREGAVFIDCPYCGSTYQMVEEPKW
jgi:Zn finger protein HypA/HybF involved in hydrogenase expression